MFKLKIFKNADRVINLENESISLDEMNKILQILNNQVVQDASLSFQVADNTEYTVPSEQSFFEILKAQAGIILSEQALQSRVINAAAIQSDEFVNNIKRLVLTIDPSLQSELEAKKQQKTSLSGQLQQSLSEEEKQKFARLQEVESRIKSVQEQVDFYQNEKKLKDEINKEIKSLKTEQDTISQMLKSVELIITKKNELQSKIDSFNSAAPSKEEVTDLKSKKIEFTNTNLSSKRNAPIINSEEDENKRQRIFEVNPTVVLAILNIVITIIGFLYSYSFSVLLAGMIFSVILSLLYIISRFYKDALEGLPASEDDLALSAQMVPNVAPVAQVDNVRNYSDPNSQLFINSALLNALKLEIDLLGRNIEKNLNGKSYETLQADLKDISSKLAQKNTEIEELSSKSITSDEYYKKRREVDILKIEKENIEFGFKGNSESLQKSSLLDQEIQAISKKIELATQVSQFFPVFLIDAASVPQISNQIILVNPK